LKAVAQKVAASGAEPQSRTGKWRKSGSEWAVIGAIAAAFTIMSLVDIGLAFYPLSPGSREWEFATATTVINNFPLGVVGIGLLAVAGIGRGSAGQVRTARVLAGLLVVLVLGMAVMFGRNVGAALASLTDPLLVEGMKEQIVRTSVQLVAYFAALVWVVVQTGKWSD